MSTPPTNTDADDADGLAYSPDDRMGGIVLDPAAWATFCRLAGLDPQTGWPGAVDGPSAGHGPPGERAISTDNAHGTEATGLPPLVGEPCESPLERAEFVGDVLYHDGPVVSVFRDVTSVVGSLLLVSWCDQGNISHRWAVARITPQLLRRMGDGEVTLRDLLNGPEAPAERWLVDLSAAPRRAEVDGDHGPRVPDGCPTWDIVCVGCVRVASFPEEYLPGVGSKCPRTDWAAREALEALETP